jgi:hypothetical protein
MADKATALTDREQFEADRGIAQARGVAPATVDTPPAVAAHSVEEKDGSTHMVGGAKYVLDHVAKKVFVEAKEPDGIKLRATGGDYDNFVKKLPPADQKLANDKADQANADKAKVAMEVDQKTAVERAQAAADQAKADHDNAAEALKQAQLAHAEADKALADAKKPVPVAAPAKDVDTKKASS